MYPDGQEILVVDSDLARRERVVRILAQEGFSVTPTAEGLSALRAVGAKRFALAIAALRLPGSLDGPTTLRQARARQPGLKALFTDGSGALPERRNPDIDDFIASPFERHELLGCVFELLQRGDIGAGPDLRRRVRAELRVS
jgi:two-component system cell cycle sensor histidine kinase/response regulator CckA